MFWKKESSSTGLRRLERRWKELYRHPEPVVLSAQWRGQLMGEIHAQAARSPVYRGSWLERWFFPEFSFRFALASGTAAVLTILGSDIPGWWAAVDELLWLMNDPGGVLTMLVLG